VVHFAYASEWAPNSIDLTLAERHRPIYAVVVAHRADDPAVGIVGPDTLGVMAAQIVRLAGDRGLETSFDTALTADLALAVERFQVGACALKFGGRKNRSASAVPAQQVLQEDCPMSQLQHRQ
jgi:microcystin degradation protein MlrC